MFCRSCPPMTSMCHLKCWPIFSAEPDCLKIMFCKSCVPMTSMCHLRCGPISSSELGLPRNNVLQKSSPYDVHVSPKMLTNIFRRTRLPKKMFCKSCPPMTSMCHLKCWPISSSELGLPINDILQKLSPYDVHVSPKLYVLFILDRCLRKNKAECCPFFSGRGCNFVWIVIQFFIKFC